MAAMQAVRNPIIFSKDSPPPGYTAVMDVAAFIADTSFFKGLSPQACARIASRTVLRNFRKGRVLFREGEAGTVVYMLASGRVKLSRTTEEGAESVVRLMGPGELFGEVILFERNAYPVMATCLSAVSAAILQRADLRALLADEAFRLSFIELLFGKQRELVSRIQQLTAVELAQRLFFFLRTHYGAARRIRMDVSKKDVAAALGITPESLSRLLRQLREQDILHWDGRAVTLRQDPERAVFRPPPQGGEAGGTAGGRAAAVDAHPRAAGARRTWTTASGGQKKRRGTPQAPVPRDV